MEALQSRKKKPVGHGAAQGGARDLRPGAGREPGGDAAGGGGEEQAEQVAQLHARALFRIEMATIGDLKCQTASWSCAFSLFGVIAASLACLAPSPWILRFYRPNLYKAPERRELTEEARAGCDS